MSEKIPRETIDDIFATLDEMRREAPIRKREKEEDEAFRKRIRDARKNHELLGKSIREYFWIGIILGALFGWWFGAVVATIIICTTFLICCLCYHDRLRKTAVELMNANEAYDAHLNKRRTRKKGEKR